MSILFACAFSLLWGGFVWAMAIAMARGRLAPIWSPGMVLAAIAASVIPCVVLVLGWQWPLRESVFAAVHMEAAGAELRAIADIANRSVMVAGGSAPVLETVVAVLYFSGLAVAAQRRARGTARLFSILRAARRVTETPGGWPLLVTHLSVPPFAVGGPLASIVLPEKMLDALGQEQIAMIVAHEEAHLRHRDPLVSQSLALLCMIFWFNPFVTDLVRRWRSATELRADSDALKNAGPVERRSYAQALIGAMDTGANPLPVSFTSRNIRNEKMRIRAILRGFKFAGVRRTRLIACCAALTLAAAGTAGALSANSSVSTTLEDFISGSVVVSPYGVERKNLRVHTGVDVAARRGADIIAPNDALVTQATDLFRGNPRWGKAVVLEFDGDVVVWLTHLDSYTVSPGDRVSAGQIIGTVGNTGQSTGSHVHVEVYKNRRRVDPVTIWPFLKYASK